MKPEGFSALVPERFIDAVEQALDIRLTGTANPLTSYINRVYELEAEDRTRYVAKFYRPGRWAEEALRDEHRFVRDCESAEIPVVAPIVQTNGDTLGCLDGVFFAVFPKRHGRQFEICGDEDWIRLGHLLGRTHVAGSRMEAPARIRLHPETSTENDIVTLLDGDFMPPHLADRFETVADTILDTIEPGFDGLEFIRIHGDCHNGNLLDRPDEGMMIIDFDDMAMGPPVQDLWMLLPDHVDKARKELNLILEGYEQFRSFDYSSIRVIESLRVMRMLYFLAWCSTQIDDYRFQRNFPDWGSDGFWESEIRDLEQQLNVIRGA